VVLELREGRHTALPEKFLDRVHSVVEYIGGRERVGVNVAFIRSLAERVGVVCVYPGVPERGSSILVAEDSTAYRVNEPVRFPGFDRGGVHK